MFASLDRLCRDVREWPGYDGAQISVRRIFSQEAGIAMHKAADLAGLRDYLELLGYEVTGIDWRSQRPRVRVRICAPNTPDIA